MGDDALNPDSAPHPLTGGYYWVPIPPVSSVTWRVLTCHELGFDEDEGHPEIWPSVVAHLSEAWGRDPDLMRRRLGRYCYGLPRGRVTHPEKKAYLILHGDDSPIDDWTEAVVRKFNLRGRSVKPLFDEHERRLPVDVRALARALGPFLALIDSAPSG